MTRCREWFRDWGTFMLVIIFFAIMCVAGWMSQRTNMSLMERQTVALERIAEECAR